MVKSRAGIQKIRKPIPRAAKLSRRLKISKANVEDMDVSRDPCHICQIVDLQELVQCGTCHLWFHLGCAKITSDIDSHDWHCERCKPTKIPLSISSTETLIGPTSLVNIEAPHPIGNSTTLTKAGSTTSSTSSRKKALALQKLEEEKLLRQQRDKDYLESKYAILEEDSSDQDVSFEEDELTVSKLERVKTWNYQTQKLRAEMKKGQSNTVRTKLSLHNCQEPGVPKGPFVESSHVSIFHRPQVTESIVQCIATDQPAKGGPTASDTHVKKMLETGLAMDALQLYNKTYWRGQQLQPSSSQTTSSTQTRPTSREITAKADATNIPQTKLSVSLLNRPVTLRKQPNVPKANKKIHASQPIRIPTSLQSYKIPTSTKQSFIKNQQPFGFYNQSIGSSSQNTSTTKPTVIPFGQPMVTVPQSFVQQPKVTVGQPFVQQPITTVSQPFMQHPIVTVSQPFVQLHQPFQLTSQTTMSQNLSQPLIGTNQTFMTNNQPVVSIQQSSVLSHQTTAVTSHHSHGWSQPIMSSSQSVPIYSSMSNGQSFFANQPLTAPPNNYYARMGNSAGNMPMSGTHEQRERLTRDQIAARQVIDKKLPIFYGNPEEWDLWYNRYISTTTKCNFDNSENLDRLEKCLKGRARDIVKSRMNQSESVPWIITTLQMIFGRPETVLKSSIKKIREFPPIKADNLESLMDFAFEVQSVSTTIESLGCQSQYTNPMLLDELTDKLPPQEKKDWARFKRGNPNVTIRTLANWLYELAGDLSTVVEPTVVKYIDKRNQKEPQKTSSSKSYINMQVENTSIKNTSKTSEKIKKCPSCTKESCTKLMHCKKFKDASRSDKWSIVKNNKLCSRCLGGHSFYRCRSDQVCRIEGCKLNHHTLLHNSEKSKNEPLENVEKVNKSSLNADKPSSSHDTQHCNSQRSNTLQRTDIFRIVPIMLYHRNKPYRDYAYLDDGSNMTTMEESLANEMGLDGTPAAICVDWAFGQTHSTEDSKIVSMGISGFFDNAPRFKLNNVRTVKDLHLPSQSITTSWLDQFSHLKNVPISTYESIKPRILIGLQYSRLIVSLETIEGNDDQPIACKTRLGWVVQGPSYKDSTEKSTRRIHSMNICESHPNDDKLHQLVKEYFASENCGVKISDRILESKETQRSREILESTTIKKDGRYETGLLWKYDVVELPDSYNMALKRLKCLESNLEKNPQLKENLHNQIKQFMEKKYIRKLSSDELQQDVDRVWYLPTFPVFNPKKPEKVRIVWDAAAKVKNISLNSMLLTGPDQLVSLVAVLRRFRERAVAITGDIREMYHQVRIRESDRNVQRFLWREDPSNQPDVYTMDVMTFGSTCSPSSAQFIKDKNAIEFKERFPRAVEAIIENHYVDDMIDCTHTVDEAAQLVNEVKEIHQHAGFEIRKFTSNSKELLHKIGENLDQQNKNMNISTTIKTERVLGMFWDTASDYFTYSLKFTGVDEKMISGNYCPTKREVLRILMSVFDPLGLLANFLVYAKILLQEIWRSNVEWDKKITQPIYVKWCQWIKMLPNVENLQIPRLYSTKLSPNEPTSIQLHIFVDASVEAYAAAAYLRIKDDEGVDCCLIGAKTKVAPNKPMSVPRLEIQGGVLGTRLAGDIIIDQTLKLAKRIFWTDSQTVLGWINSEARRYNQFVSFRIGEILETSEPKEWRWIPSEHNVADEATKSKEIPKVRSSSRWYKAPKFLYDNESTWFIEDGPDEFHTEEEMKPSFIMACNEIVRERLIDIKRFSNWNRLLRAQAYVFRFVHNGKSDKRERHVGPLSQEELIKAENHLYRRAQRDEFLDEVLILKQNRELCPEKWKNFDKSSQLRTYPLYLDDQEVLRIKGRIDAATCVGIETKRPVMLPRHHYITKLIVGYYHCRYKHLNHQTALNEIKQKYEVPALRVVMKGIRSSCQKCKNATVKPQIPEMAELPAARLAAYTEPFTYVGVDYFGPYKVKVKRSLEKRWGVIFTCMTTRAVHLEKAHSLSTSSCIMSVENFIRRRGQVREFYSDNGTNFHGANNELKAEFEKLNRDDIEAKFTSTEMKWKFNPPLASHMGGSWERLIRTIKSCLDQVMTTRHPTEEMLTNLFTEVEDIVNTRPLTYVPLESADDEALTPNHFLKRSSNGQKPLGKFTDKDLLRNDWKAVQQQTNHFWRRFVLEYMPTLTKHTKWLKQAKPLEVGDVVLLIDETNERNTYPKGIVEQVIVGKGGKIRQAIVRTENAIVTGKPGQSIVKTVSRIYKRPVAKLAVLDVKPPNENHKVKLVPMESHNGWEDVGQHWIANITDLLSSVN